MSKLNYCFVFLVATLAVGCYVLHKLVDRMIETRKEVEKMAKDFRKTENYLLTLLEQHEVEMNYLKERFETDMQTISAAFDNLKGNVLPMVAFSAFKPIDIHLNTNQVFILGSVLINEGNGYDTTTGKFTAPVGGLYHFTAHVCNTHGLVIHYAIVKDGKWIAPSQQFEQANENIERYASCNSVSALMMLKPGDKVWILCTSGYTSNKQIRDDTYRRNTFIGVLLHK